MTQPDISTQIRIQSDPDYAFTVEDTHIGVGCDGLTISAWFDGARQDHVCIDKELALAVADAIYKLFKEENN